MPSSVAEARERVERLHAAELELEERRQALAAELEAARSDAGDAILEAVVAGRQPASNRRAVGLREELAATDGAIGQARRRRVEAIGAAWRAEAAELRAEAVTLAKEISERQARTDELLAALEAHEGVRYVPYRPVNTPTVPGVLRTVVIPATDWKRGELATLERRAAELEARRVSDRGHVTVATRHQLVAALRGWNPFALAPALAEALAWFDAVAATWTGRTPQGEPAPFTAELVWRDGRVDSTRSRLQG